MSITTPGSPGGGSGSAQVGRPRPGLAATAAWVVVGVGALIGLTLWSDYNGHPATGLFTVDVVVGAASCCLLPVLLRWPVPGAVGLAVLSAVSPAATPAASFGALHVGLRRPFAVAAAVGGTGIAAQLIGYLWRPFTGLSFGWWALLVVAAYAALVGWGAWIQARQSLVASLYERARAAETEQGRRVAEARLAERTQIAREMHDVLAHRLSLVATYAGALEYRPDAPPDQLANAAGVIRASVHQALSELRDVIAVLRDTESAADFSEHPQPVLADLPGLIEEASIAGTCIQLDNGLADSAPPAAVGRTAYRIVQEGLTNARKHAAGQPVRVILSGAAGTELTIEISNPVPAGLAAPVAPGSGTGLVGLSERVQLAGGQLEHQLVSGEFRMRAWIPWPV